MKIQEFAKERNVSYATVFQYIKRHPDLFDGHIGKSNNIVLDDTALQILDERYPRENPVQVICDTEARDRLAVLQEKYISLLEENNRLTQENANLMLEHHKNMLLEEELEAHQKELEELRSLRKEQRSWVKEFNSQSREIAGLENLLAKERQERGTEKHSCNRNWIKRGIKPGGTSFEVDDKKIIGNYVPYYFFLNAVKLYV